MTLDFDKPSETVLKPSRFCHVVLRSNQFQKMVDFYKTFLGAHATYENDFLSFLTYDDEHHRIAIVAIPGIANKNKHSCGLEHTAFAYDNLSDLCLAYRHRKARGILPIWCVNHGPTTSMYYQDPDGNQLETQVDNFDTNEAANDFMKSKHFQENPLGTDFDPEGLIRKLQSGEKDADLKKRIEIGPRGLDTIPLM